jgi:hypothetical protein
LKQRGITHVLYEVRHSIADRLRNVNCPIEARYAIEGHALGNVGEDYGFGYGLPIMRDWLLKVALPDPSSPKVERENML